MAEGEQAQHLALAVRERIRLRLLRRLDVGGHQPRAELGIDVAAAARDLANRGHDLVVGRLLEDVAAGARRERLAHVARFVLHGEDEHLRVWVLVLELGKGFQAGLLGHDEVEQDYVGVQRPRLEDGIAGVARLADRLQALLRLEQKPQAATDDGVVVDDEDPDAHPRGTSATIVVPAPGRDSISSRPSTKESRSRMPSSPTPSPGTALWSKPAPSSSITAATVDPRGAIETLMLCALACLTMFVSDSWTTR